MAEPAGKHQPDLPIKQIWGTDWDLEIIIESVETDSPPPVAQGIIVEPVEPQNKPPITRDTPAVTETDRIWRDMVEVVRGGP
jgi:hypothetical protein